MPLKPFPLPSNGDPSFEIAEFSGNSSEFYSQMEFFFIVFSLNTRFCFLLYSDRDMYPYTTFANHLFVYPLTLSFDSQKLFSRARNLAMVMEVRESDEEGAKAIPVIKTIYLFSLLLSRANSNEK